MNKKSILYLTVVAIILTTLSCNTTKDEKQRMYQTAAYNFPGPLVDMAIVAGSNNIKDVKSDSFGRKMFTVWIPSSMTFYAIDCGVKDMSFRPRRAKVIMQGSDEKNIFFYEDYCFLLETEKGFPKQSVEELMERNDWNRPLQSEKMSSRLSGDVFEGMDSSFERKDQEYIESLFPNIKVVRILHINEDYNGKMLLGINTYDETNDRLTNYFMIYDQETSVDIENNLMELTTLDFGEELHQFKIQNNWDFVDCPGCDKVSCQD